MRIREGDTVRLGGFAPMSTMEHYEGLIGEVVEIEKGGELGDVVFVQRETVDRYNDLPRIIQTRRQFCTKE